MKKNKTRDDLYMEDVPQNTKATVRLLLSRLGRQKGRLLVVTAAVRNQIREGKTPQIAGTMAVSAQEGSVTMDASVLRLYQRGRISAQIAAQAARDKDFVKKHLPQSMGI